MLTHGRPCVPVVDDAIWAAATATMSAHVADVYWHQLDPWGRAGALPHLQPVKLYCCTTADVGVPAFTE